jgi:hypothetical protein
MEGQKNLDAKWSLAWARFSLVRDFSADRQLVRQSLAASLLGLHGERFSRLASRYENVRQAIDLPEIRGPKQRMTRSGKNHCGRLDAATVLAICIAVFFAACSTTPAPSPTVTRVVLVWLRHPGDPAARAQLIRAAQSLQMIPGVLRVETGRPVPGLGPDADRSFDLGVLITFRDRAALQRYEKDPHHLEAIRRYLRPLVRRYEVFNLGER